MQHPDFNSPGKPSKLTARKSTITGLFFSSLTPYIEPLAEEVDKALDILGMSRGKVSCAYCGDSKSEWDHFRPIVRNRKPTGFITELANLVPSCGKCNQSKSGKDWRVWMNSSAKLSPKSRNIADLELKIQRLDDYEKWKTPIQVDFLAVLGKSAWEMHLSHLDAVINGLVEAERGAKILRNQIEGWVMQA
jgi:hypothetical protein